MRLYFDQFLKFLFSLHRYFLWYWWRRTQWVQGWPCTQTLHFMHKSYFRVEEIWVFNVW